MFLHRLAAFAGRAGVGAAVTCEALELGSREGVARAVDLVRGADLVVVCRFLDRPLMTALAQGAVSACCECSGGDACVRACVPVA